MRKFLSLFAFLALSLALAACSGGEKEAENQEETNTNSSETVSTDEVYIEKEVEPTGKVVELVITAKNFEFIQEEVEIRAGDTVRITLENEAGYHGVGIDGYDLEVKEGEVLEFVANKKGEFEIFCSIPCGHGHDNMTGKIVIL